MKTKLMKLLVGVAVAALCGGMPASAQFASTAIGGGAPGTIASNGIQSFSVIGGGNDIGGAGDEFTFHRMPKGGDFDVRARVAWLEPNAQRTKAGLMLREGLATNSRMAYCRVTPAGRTTEGLDGANDVRFAYRTGTTSPAQGQHEDPAVGWPLPAYSNAWVRLERVGALVRAYRSVDGNGWTLVGSQDTTQWEGGPLASTVAVGFAVSRHPAGASATARAEFREFADVLADPPFVTEPPLPQNVPRGQRATFSVAIAGGYDVVTIQWRRDGVNIPGATNRSYTTPATVANDQGTTYSAAIVNTRNNTVGLSPAGVLTLVNDGIPPTLVSAGAAVSNRLGVCFSEPILPALATNLTRYAVPGATLTGVTLRPDGRSVQLTSANPLPASFTVVVNGVSDLASNAIAPNSFIAGRVWATPADIGVAAPAGIHFSCRAGDADVTAGGADIGGSADQFHFLYNRVSGPFDAVVRVQRLDPANAQSKAGLLARESLASGSVSLQAFTLPGPPTGGAVYDTGLRSTNGGPTTRWGSQPATSLPVAWIRLVRSGNVFRAYQSTDGSNWSQYAEVTQVTSNALYVGLATAARSATNLVTAEFRDFLLNTPPVLSTVSDQVGSEDVPIGPLNVNVADLETPAAGLTLQAFSANQTLVPNGNITFGGAGGVRTVTLRPEPDQSGSSLITLVVTDANGGASSNSFLVTFVPVNDPPTITGIANQVLSVNTTSAPLPFFIADVETPAASLQLTAGSDNLSLLPISGIIFGGAAGSRTVALRPAQDQVGAALVTLTVSDGGGGSNRTQFQLTVSGSPPVVLTAPQSQVANVGDTVTFRVTATGTPPLLYQWQHNGQILPGGTGSNYVVGSVQLSDAGAYAVVVRNALGSATSAPPAVLTVRALDFGDAPASYGTLLAQNGARHVIVTNFYLGQRVDGETNGQPTFDAQGDDSGSAGLDDEDGVTFSTALIPGQLARVAVVASQAGVLDAWLDWNADGIFGTGGEQIFVGTPLLAGTNSLTFLMPTGAVAGLTMTRFRFSQNGGLTPLGLAPDGEVEDYRVEIQPAPANSCDTTCAGTDFWLTFPGHYSPDPDEAVQLTLCVVGSAGTEGDVRATGPGIDLHYRIDATGMARVTLRPEADLGDVSDAVQAKGVHVTATRPVTLYAVSHVANSSDGYLALPTLALGTEYRVTGFGNVHTGIPDLNGSQFAIVAVADGTDVTLTLPVATGTRGAGETFHVTLQQGEAYQVRNTGDAPADLTGASIAASHPVAVFAGHACGAVPDNTVLFCNYMVEQLLPTSAWGTEFVTCPLATRPYDLFRVMARENGTRVEIPPSPAFFLDQGQHADLVLSAPARISASLPVSVMQYSVSSDVGRNPQSDPFMVTVPPTTMFQQNQEICTAPGEFTAHYANLIVPGTALGTVELKSADGTVLPLPAFLPVAGTEFWCAHLPLPPGRYAIAAAQPVGVTVYGWGEYDAYGYPGCLFLGDTSPPLVQCPAEPITIVLDDLAGPPCQAFVPDLRGEVQFSDNCGVKPGTLVRQDPPPGTIVGAGDYLIALSVVDARGNVGTCRTPLRVIDPTLPVLVAPQGILTNCTDGAGAIVSFAVKASTRCLTNLPVVCTPQSGSHFDLGSTLVTCRATNQLGEVATAAFPVTVQCLGIALKAGVLEITWGGPAILETAPTATGAWQRVFTPVGSYSVSPTNLAGFYRFRME